jgi:hypothetical protein
MIEFRERSENIFQRMRMWIYLIADAAEGVHVCVQGFADSSAWRSHVSSDRCIALRKWIVEQLYTPVSKSGSSKSSGARYN